MTDKDPKREPPPDYKMSGRIAALALLVIAGLTIVMVWVA